MNPPGSRPRSPPDPNTDPSGPRRRERRALSFGLGVSLLLHVILIALYGLTGGTVVLPGRVAAPRSEAMPEPGMEVVDIAEAPASEDPADVQPPEEPDEPAAVASAPTSVAADSVSEDPSEEEGEDLTLAERLQPRMRDARLWGPLEREFTDLSDEERAQLLLRGMIQDWNDSVAIAAALAQDARDWTYTDDEGRRWGLSPDGIYLGDFAIPFPPGFAMEIAPSDRLEWLERQRIRDDLARGAATAAIRETWAERARAIRARLEAERDGVSTPAPPADSPAEAGRGDGAADPP